MDEPGIRNIVHYKALFLPSFIVFPDSPHLANIVLEFARLSSFPVSTQILALTCNRWRALIDFRSHQTARVGWSEKKWMQMLEAATRRRRESLEFCSKPETCCETTTLNRSFQPNQNRVGDQTRAKTSPIGQEITRFN